VRLLWGLAELIDIGTCDKSPARTTNQDRLAGVLLGGIDSSLNACSHRLRQRVDRWVIDCNDANSVRDFVADRIHRHSLLKSRILVDNFW
jgi:hypothetical protein